MWALEIQSSLWTKSSIEPLTVESWLTVLPFQEDFRGQTLNNQ